MKKSSSCISHVVLVIVSAILAFGCENSTDSSGGNDSAAVDSEQTPTLRDVFNNESALGGRQAVLILPKLESKTSLALRARRLGVDVISLSPTAYGVDIYTIFERPAVGTAVCIVEAIYHLDSFPGRINRDTTYIYCDGVLSPSVLKISEKRWSGHAKADAGEISQFLRLAESVGRGFDHKAAYMALQPFGPLGALGAGSTNEELGNKEMTWLAGVQRIERVDVRIMPYPSYGNLLAAQFVGHHGAGGD
jgi:hypothetical protein